MGHDTIATDETATDPEGGNARTASRRISVLGWLGFCGLCAAWLVVWRPWRWYPEDLIVYRTGSQAFLHHQLLYDVTGGREHLHFTYPPIAAITLSPLTSLSVSTSEALVAAIGFALLAAMISCYLKESREHGRPYGPAWLPMLTAAALWLEPIRANFALGQINLLLMALVTFDVLLTANSRYSGLMTGLAAAIKLTPLAFIPYLLLIGRRRGALNASASFLLLGLLGFAIYPSASETYWGHHLFLSAHRIGRVENASNQSVRGILARLLRTTDVPSWWLVVALLVFMGCLAVAIQLHHARRPTWSLAAMSIAMLCASPISWSHHWVWCVLMMVVGIDIVRAAPSLPRLVICGAVVTPFATKLIFRAPHTAHLELSDSYWQEFKSSTYVLAGLLLVLWMAFVTRRQGKGRVDG